MRPSSPPTYQHRARQLIREQFRAGSGTSVARTAVLLPTSLEGWLRQHFPSYFAHADGHPIPFAPYHHAFWTWVATLKPGFAPDPFVCIVARAGGKSTMAEMGCAVAAEFQLRRYVVYVCATQDQADDHVGTNIARLLEHRGIDRMVSKYGASRGWRRNRVWTNTGFVADALGLDTAGRGAKIEEARPDLFVLDDIDREHDTPATTEKKIKTLTQAVLPSGAQDAAVLAIQNLLHANGLFAQLVDGRADFLLKRQLQGPFPALENFQYDITEAGVVIRQGDPVWEGLGIPECQRLIERMGPRAFNIECQHRTELVTGTFFQREWFRIVEDWPARHGHKVRYWDLAATEAVPGKDPDWTCGCLMAEYRGQYWIVEMVRIRGRPYQVEQLIAQTAARDGKDVEIGMEQEPGATGVIALDFYERYVLPGYTFSGFRGTGAKPIRAKPLSSATEAGNVFVVRGGWNNAFFDEALNFPSGGYDDQTDSASGAFTMLTTARRAHGLSRVRISGY